MTNDTSPAVFLGGLYCALLVALGIAHDLPVVTVLSMVSLGVAYMSWQFADVADLQVAWHWFGLLSMAAASMVAGIVATALLFIALL